MLQSYFLQHVDDDGVLWHVLNAPRLCLLPKLFHDGVHDDRAHDGGHDRDHGGDHDYGAHCEQIDEVTLIELLFHDEPQL